MVNARELMELKKLPGKESSNGTSCKFGLVIEGGGMRGLISCAYLEALSKLGYEKCFDNVYGTSAGALNGAYFLSGQITLGTSIYYENLATKRFINIFRWPNPMDINYLFNNWVCGDKKLDINSLLSNKTPLIITATDCETGLPEYFSTKNLSKDELIKALRASSSTPMFTNNKEFINGKLYNDGMLNDGIPLISAIKDGCTHILCLLTRQKGYRKTKNIIFEYFENLRLSEYSKEYVDVFHQRQSKYNETLDVIEKNSYPGVDIISITPEPTDMIVGNGEINGSKLQKSARDALMRACMNLGFAPKTITLGFENAS